MNLLEAIINKEETEKAIKLLKKAIKEDYLCKSEVQEFYELFKKNEVGIFLDTGELYSCNKRNAERLINSLKEGYRKESENKCNQRLKSISIRIGVISAIIGLLGKLLELYLTTKDISISEVFDIIERLFHSTE